MLKMSLNNGAQIGAISSNQLNKYLLFCSLNISFVCLKLFYYEF